ncbi:MAG: DUF58 domain-containing protein [Dehalococcoidia bacterium]
MAAVTAADASAAVVPIVEPPSPELLAQVRRIEIRARRLASTLLTGDYRSVFRGSGIEFAEAREYVVGDDVRMIDWNVTARMGAPWVKEYVEERELSVVCAVDVSGSQLVARAPSGRLGAAAELSALLSFAAIFHHDRAGLLTFTDRIERFVAPAHGSRHVLRMVREVLHHQPVRAGTSIAAAADYLARVLPRRSIVVLISDFYDQGYEQSLRTLARRHEVLALTLTDPLDLELPDLGIVEVEDAERGGRLLVDTSDRAVRRRYAEAALARVRVRRQALASAGVDEVAIRLDQDLVHPLVAYFRGRAARR